MDPRLSIIDYRLKNINRLIAISGGKGGIGKSLTASTLALSLSKLGYMVGLLDLDFCGPSTHIILGVKVGGVSEGIYPKEEKGVIPPVVYGIKFMSIVYYAGDNPSPLRGIDISNAMIELLTITQWGSLDFLIIDMPPGMGDAILDTIRLIKRAEFLVLTTGSKLALETGKKLLKLLKELGTPIIGVIENMCITNSSIVQKEIEKFNTKFLGVIDFDRALEDSLGDVNKLLETQFAQDVEKIIKAIFPCH